MDKKLLVGVKEHIKQGFQWGAREGPLCDEREWQEKRRCVLSDDVGSDAKREIPDIGRKSGGRADIPRRWTDCSHSTPSVLLVVPHGERNVLITRRMSLRKAVAGHAPANGAGVLCRGAGTS